MATQTRKTQTAPKTARKTATTSTDIQITSNKPKGGTAEPVNVDLQGEVYSFVPVKAGVLMAGMLNPNAGEMEMARSVSRWLGHSVSEEHYERILERLADPEDVLDLDDLMETMQAVTEFAAGRPTS